MRADLLEALKVLTELAVQAVGNNLRVLAVGDIALSVQEPARDLVLGWGLEDGDDTLELFGGEFTGTVENFVSTSAGLAKNFVGDLCSVSGKRALCPADEFSHRSRMPAKNINTRISR